MAKASPAITNFNAGEFSPLLAGRFDLQKYPNAASVLENFIPTVQGPLVKRAGTRYVGNSKRNGACVLVPFEFSVSQAYVIEFGEWYARFYTTDSATGERGLLVQSDGSAVEVATPYGLDDIFNADGSTKLRWAQSADVLYVCCPGHPVYVLKRVSAVSFVFEWFEAKNGPFEDLNDSTDKTVYASASWGEVSLHASAPIFSADMVGDLFYLETPDFSAIKLWQSGTRASIGDWVRSDAKHYECIDAPEVEQPDKNSLFTGTSKPMHAQGAEWDGSGHWAGTPEKGYYGVKWAFRDPGYGHVRITEFVNTRQVKAQVYSDNLPTTVVGSENATKRWAYAAWSKRTGYPTSVAFFRSRLWFARGQKVWGSVTEDFTDFAAKDCGDVTANMAVSLTLASGQINEIQWLLPDKNLIAGTAAGEFAIGELTNGDALGPENVRAVLQSEFGSKSIQPVKNGNSILFIQRAGLKAREFFYDFGSDGYASSDVASFASHITTGDGLELSNGSGMRAYGVIAVAFAQEPDPIVWMVRTDRQLVGFTWNNDQEVRGWHRHTTQGEVVSIAVVPAFEGDRDELWLCVKRMINGQAQYCVEYMAAPYRAGDDLAKQFYVDCGLTYQGSTSSPLAKEVRGLGHLEGCVVAVLADGSPQPHAVVCDGAVQLSIPARSVQVGLPYEAVYRSMRIEAGAADGTAQGKTKRIHKAVYRMLDTGSGHYGARFDRLEQFQFRTPQHAMGVAVPLFSGDKLVEFPGDYETEGYLVFASKQPNAATLLGIFPQLLTQDR